MGEEHWKQVAEHRLAWMVATGAALFCAMSFMLMISVVSFYIIFTKITLW